MQEREAKERQGSFLTTLHTALFSDRTVQQFMAGLFKAAGCTHESLTNSRSKDYSAGRQIYAGKRFLSNPMRRSFPNGEVSVDGVEAYLRKAIDSGAEVSLASVRDHFAIDVRYSQDTIVQALSLMIKDIVELLPNNEKLKRMPETWGTVSAKCAELQPTISHPGRNDSVSATSQQNIRSNTRAFIGDEKSHVPTCSNHTAPKPDNSSPGEPKFPDRTQLGTAFVFPWVTVASGPWPEDRIIASYDQNEQEYHPQVIKWANEITEEWKAEVAKGGIGSLRRHNGHGMSLVSFNDKVRTGSDEDSALQLNFKHTDYIHNLASDQKLDEPFFSEGRLPTTLRTELAFDHDYADAPIPGIANHFGIQLSIVTKDNKLIIPMRGNTAVDPYCFSPSVAEGSLPGQDVKDGAYYPSLTAARALMEEYGVIIEPSNEIEWISFGANTITGQYALIGTYIIDDTFANILSRHSFKLAKDAWENATLFGIDFSPHSFSSFITSHDNAWSVFAINAFIHHLIQEFGFDAVCEAVGFIKPSIAGWRW